MRQKRIAYVGQFRFPDGDAAAARVVGIGKCLRESGFEVLFAGAERRSCRDETIGHYQGFPYRLESTAPSDKRGILRRFVKYVLQGTATVRWLERMERPPCAVILYNGPTSYHMRLRKYCRDNNVSLVVDVTEWYSPFQCVGGALGLHRWDVELSMRRWNVLADGVISVSRYLDDYYRTRTAMVIRVPPLVDLQDPKWVAPKAKSATGVLKAVYAGSPGKKDNLQSVLRGMSMANRNEIVATLDVIGPDTNVIQSQCTRLGLDWNSVRRYVTCAGRIPQGLVPQQLASADVGILLRPVARYSAAGFSTKLVEYLAVGTPVLTNYTGDIAEYVRNNREGFVLANDSPEEFARGIGCALAKGRTALAQMRNAAREQAETSFDYRVYTTKMGQFVTDVLERGHRKCG